MNKVIIISFLLFMIIFLSMIYVDYNRYQEKTKICENNGFDGVLYEGRNIDGMGFKCYNKIKYNDGSIGMNESIGEFYLDK